MHSPSTVSSRFSQHAYALDSARNVLLALAGVAFFTLATTWFCRIIVDTIFGVTLNNTYWQRDFFGNLALAFIAFILVQKLGKTLLLAGVIVVGFQLANGAKLVVLGTPISPDDFINVHNLFYLTDGWRRVMLIAVATLPIVLTLSFTRWRSPSVWVAVASIVTVVLIVQYNSETARKYLDARFGHSVWNQPENFTRRGLGLHIAQESVRTMAKVGRFPDQASVDKALQNLPTMVPDTIVPTRQTESTVVKNNQTSFDSTQRNVHIIVLESFFDPITLGPDWVPEDPLPASFRALWKQTGFSKALSPVFGGYTANAEFETLCGFPVTENAVFFEGWLRRSVPCLPEVLSEAGYKTVASHPNVPGFWNRTHAYNLVGFDTYLSKSDFDLSDSVGSLLLDHSYYDQVFKHDQLTDQNAPVLNYMLTYHGHLPYPKSDQYPDQIKAGKESALLHGYLNQIWYKSRDLMERIEQLRKDDPTALIVTFGDHLPFLNPNYGVYSDALNLPDDRADFTGEMLEYLVSTPLIIIDGERGPLDLGKLPLYQLPSLILDLLGKDSGDRMFAWTENPEDILIRPLYGMHIKVSDDETIACPDDDSAPVDCKISQDWLTRTRLLISDIFTGHQYSLRKLQTSNDS